jgi:hypothetical protein
LEEIRNKPLSTIYSNKLQAHWVHRKTTAENQKKEIKPYDAKKI